MSSSDAPTRRGKIALFAGLALLALAPWVMWRSMLALELLGWDSYPLIAASRADSALDLVREFGDELMDGRYPFGHYWRPVTHLVFALDHALWGLEPRGYHATDIALLAVNSVLIALFARRWLGDALGIAAGFWFAAHLVHVDVLPFPARRADALASAFTMLALLAASSPLAARVSRRIGASIACAFALMAKEPGVVATALVIAYPFFAESGGLRERALRAMRSGWMPACVTAAVIAARYFVLGTVGGAENASVADAVLEAPQMWSRYAQAPWMPSGLRTGWLPDGAALAAFAAVLVLAYLASAKLDRRAASSSTVPRTGQLAFLLAWFALLASVTAMAGAERRWYDLPFAVHGALFFPLLVALLVEAAAPRASVSARSAAGALIVVASSWPGFELALSPDSRIPPELRAASDAQRAYLDRIGPRVIEAAPGALLAPQGFVAEAKCAEPGLDGRVRTITVLAPYSLEAYLHLVAPTKSVRLEYPGAPPRDPSPSDVVVRLRP